MLHGLRCPSSKCRVDLPHTIGGNRPDMTISVNWALKQPNKELGRKSVEKISEINIHDVAF